MKTPEQATTFGGTAGQPFDPCYHEACDTTRNLSNRAFISNADAIAHVTQAFAQSTEAVNGRELGSSLAASALRAARADVVRTPQGVLAE